MIESRSFASKQREAIAQVRFLSDEELSRYAIGPLHPSIEAVEAVLRGFRGILAEAVTARSVPSVAN